MTMPIDVPAQVQYEHFVENNVQVQGGNNWDFSRRARVTPIGPFVEAPAVTEAGDARSVKATKASDEERRPIALLEFAPEEITLNDFARSVLVELPKESSLTITARMEEGETDAERLARVRAEAVASFLRTRGYDVQSVEVLNGEASESSNSDPRVEIFLEGSR